MKKSAAVFILAFLAAAPARAFTLSNFDSPESVAIDYDDDSYYVSNVNGGLSEKDGNGYISRINSTGSLVIQRYIGGNKDEMLLNAPKGLAIVGPLLYVADIDTVKAFDKRTRKPAAIIDLSPFSVRFLNDLVADRFGNLYVSDTMTNRIFRIDPSDGYKVRVYVEGPILSSPNGLLINPKTRNLMIATWESGQLLEVDSNGKVHVLKRGLSQLDGIDYDPQGNIYLSSYGKGEIYRIAFYGRGALATYVNGLMTPADISYDRHKNELLIPSFKGNKVTAYQKIETPVKK
ncbi:MAG TPA: hypothetical protein VL404_00195 [Candidatus Eisenbacteria bacterium]|jgi:DNA-binding beta-propeller fold protein YncE|nr:hypothetical protein [Candidatus Eisenbacteria bacterium]